MAFLKRSQKTARRRSQNSDMVFVKAKKGNKVEFLIWFCLQCSRKISVFVTGNESVTSVLIPFNAHKLLIKSKLSTTKYTKFINNYDSGQLFSANYCFQDWVLWDLNWHKLHLFDFVILLFWQRFLICP